MKKKQFVIHPYLFVLYPIITLLASNLDQISPGIGLRAAFILIFGTALLMLIFWLWMKDISKAGLAVSLMVFLIFSFTHIINLVDNWGKHLNKPVVTIVLLSIFCVLILLVPWIIWRFVKSTPDSVTTFLNIMGVVIVILPLIQIGSYFLRTPDAMESINEETILVNQNHVENNNLPDIYYIIVDGYGRADILQEIYGYDNSGFLDNLSERGFYVAEQSSANYMQTYLSLSSSLNFGYLDELAQTLGDELDRRDPLTYLIQQNQVRKVLEEAGYDTIIYDSDWPVIDTVTDTPSLAFNENPSKAMKASGFNSFEAMLWRNTIFNYFTPSNLSFDDHRNLILENFAGLKSAAALEGPKLVIGHVISPHPPFVFNAAGQFIQPDYEYSIHDGEAFAGSREAYLKGYSGQIAHINTLLLDTVDHILTESDQPPIIIIQGDHGPGSTLDFSVLENNSCFKERQTILNAYYFPDGNYDTLYESITPVNSFRIVLNKIIGLDLDLVADKNYFSLWNTPYDFIDVTDKLNSCHIEEN